MNLNKLDDMRLFVDQYHANEIGPDVFLERLISRIGQAFAEHDEEFSQALAAKLAR